MFIPCGRQLSFFFTVSSFPDCFPLLFSQTSQGVQPKRFKTLPELVSLYLQPSQGLVTTLLYAVDREETVISDDRDYSGISRARTGTFTSSVIVPILSHVNSPALYFIDGEDEKPPLPPRSASASTPPGADTPTDRYKVYFRIKFIVYSLQQDYISAENQICKASKPTLTMIMLKHDHVTTRTQKMNASQFSSAHKNNNNKHTSTQSPSLLISHTHIML